MALPHNEHILHDLDKKFEVKPENGGLAGSSAFSVVTPKGVNQIQNVSTPPHSLPKPTSIPQATNSQTPSTPRAPFTLPGLGIERHTTQPYLNYPKELLSYMFLPFNKGMVLPPEYPFGVPGMPHVPDMRNQVPNTQVPHQPTNAPRETAPSITRDAPSMQHIRLAIEDRDSGNESSSLSPPYSFSSSRSPSHSSRSNSFSMSSLLRPSENHQAQALVNTPVAPNFPQTPQAAQQALPTPNTPSTPNSALNHRQMQHPGPPSFMLMPHTPMMNMSLPYNQQYMQMQLEQLRAKMATEDIILPGREVCEVCGDNASGFHYGVMSCEGCKGFFRRSVQKSMNYQCHRDGSCKVDRISRNRCQACRFQKCLSKGMTKESVRNDRVRKRKTSDDEREKEFDSTRDLLVLSNDVIRAYRMAFPDNYKILSDKDAQMRCLDFVKNVSAFQCVREQFPQIVQNSFLGLMHLRFAKSEFPTDDVNINMKLIGRLQQGLKNITEEELALLSAIHCANPIQTPEASANPGVPCLDGASNPVWEKLVECLRVYRSSNNSSDKNQLFSLLQLLYQLATLSV